MSYYGINAETLLIVPYGRGMSKVYEVDREFIVNRSTLDIIKDGCLFFGCSYEGRRDAVRNILGVDLKIPILIEDSHNIIFFPTTNCVNKSSIWISYQNLVKYVKKDEFSTALYFRCDKRIAIDVKYTLVDNQFIRCMKLNSFINKRKEFIETSRAVIE